MSYCTTERLLSFVAMLVLAFVQHTSSARAQNINSILQSPPASEPAFEMIELLPPTEEGAYGVQPTPLFAETPLNANYVGRVAVLGDSTRLANFAEGRFLPSAIPVPGEPFFGTGSRANLQGDGSAVNINGYVPREYGVRASAHAQLLVTGAQFSSTSDSGSANVTISQVFGQIHRLSVGVMESAFADPAAVPEVLDLAGPNARVTVFPAGLGKGQGRLSCNLFADGTEGGFTTVASIEQPRPQIATGTTEGTFADYPDLVIANQYVEGFKSDAFHETWHVQFGSVFRSLGIENSSDTLRENVFGWGIALSGAYHLGWDFSAETRDRIVFSATYGEGISHYITDLNAAPNSNDAVIISANTLVSLPVFAWYVGYTHNWTDRLRSTATYSHVSLDSATPLGVTASPYRNGEFVAVNLLYHRSFLLREKDTKHNIYTGVEYLFGNKEALNGADGEAQRIMWVTAISK